MTVTDLSAPDETRDAAAAGTAAFRRRDFAGAAARFASATAATPADASAWLSLARAEALAGRLAAARRACDEAARRDPRDRRAPRLGARLAARADDARARIAHLRAAVALDPGAVALRLELAAALGRRLQHGPALAVAEELLALAPGDPAVRLAAARCLLALNRFGEAEAELDRSGAGEALEAERLRLRADLAARRERAGAPPAAGPAAGMPVATGAAAPVARRDAAGLLPAPPPADVEGALTAAALGRIERIRRRPRVTDHLLILYAVVLRDLRAHHRGSLFGVLVELVRPAVVVFVHYWLFYWLKKPMPGQIPIAVYVLAGFATWFAFQSAWSGASNGGKWPAGATAWPGITDLHLRLAKAGWGLMLHLAFCLLALLPIAASGVDLPAPNVPETCLIFAMAGVSGFGLGLTLEGLGRRLAFVKTVEKLLTWALFITSGLYFSIATTPVLVARWYWYDPLLHLVEHERHAFDPGYPVALLDLRYPAVFTVGLIVTGLLVYRSAGCPDHD